MRLTEQDVRAFIEVYEAEYGVRLSLEDAWEMALKLVALYEVAARPLPEIEYEE